MTEAQRQALKLMAERNAGAIFADGRWIWVNDIRNDEAAALAILGVLR